MRSMHSNVAMHILISALGFVVTSAFSLSQLSSHSKPFLPLTRQYASSSDDVDFMASLRSRMDEISDKETKVPLVIIDSMLPRQVFKLLSDNPLLMELVHSRIAEESPYFGVVGMAQLMTGQQVHLKTGVEVEIVGHPAVSEEGLQLEIRAGRRFRIEGGVASAAGGWTEARVKFIDTEEEEAEEVRNGSDRMALARAMRKARYLTDLVPGWIELARSCERQPGQIDQLLVDLGDMPPPEEPSERAFWVGALINPIPVMGVSLEIRPSLLNAQTAEERVEIALKGIRGSIGHMNGSAKLF